MLVCARNETVLSRNVVLNEADPANQFERCSRSGNFDASGTFNFLNIDKDISFNSQAVFNHPLCANDRSQQTLEHVSPLHNASYSKGSAATII